MRRASDPELSRIRAQRVGLCVVGDAAVQLLSCLRDDNTQLLLGDIEIVEGSHPDPPQLIRNHQRLEPCRRHDPLVRLLDPAT